MMPFIGDLVKILYIIVMQIIVSLVLVTSVFYLFSAFCCKDCKREIFEDVNIPG